MESNPSLDLAESHNVQNNEKTHGDKGAEYRVANHRVIRDVTLRFSELSDADERHFRGDVHSFPKSFVEYRPVHLL